MKWWIISQSKWRQFKHLEWSASWSAIIHIPNYGLDCQMDCTPKLILDLDCGLHSKIVGVSNTHIKHPILLALFDVVPHSLSHMHHIECSFLGQAHVPVQANIALASGLKLLRVGGGHFRSSPDYHHSQHTKFVPSRPSPCFCTGRCCSCQWP